MDVQLDTITMLIVRIQKRCILDVFLEFRKMFRNMFPENVRSISCYFILNVINVVLYISSKIYLCQIEDFYEDFQDVLLWSLAQYAQTLDKRTEVIGDMVSQLEEHIASSTSEEVRKNADCVQPEVFVVIVIMIRII